MSAGATPSGVRPGDEAATAANIREMFGKVAPRYDLLNRLLSGRIDVYWRSVLVRSVSDVLERPEARVLDLCCGTGDVVLALEKFRRKRLGAGAAVVLGSDFCRPMLEGAMLKLAGPGRLVEADAMRFPARNDSVDLISVSFGFRNLANYTAGLEEFHRLLAPGGVLAILEFSQPTMPVWGPVFNWYFRKVLPRIGNAISGAGDAYSYLQRSVGKFLGPEELVAEMEGVGFESANYRSLTGGIACLHVACKGTD